VWRFCTLNINSFTNWDKCLAVKEIYECDLVCFQETRLVGARARGGRRGHRAATWVARVLRGSGALQCGGLGYGGAPHHGP
jgi:exonuclease III